MPNIEYETTIFYWQSDFLITFLLKRRMAF